MAGVSAKKKQNAKRKSLANGEPCDPTAAANGERGTRRGKLYRIEGRAVEGCPGVSSIPADVAPRRSDSDRDHLERRLATILAKGELGQIGSALDVSFQ